jgi:hypothetical protein
MSRKPELRITEIPKIEVGLMLCLGCGPMVGFPAVLA